ncbi:hypothetical protein MKW94_016451 [Papaver nudicaule]|uniref:UBC core domain-containing protein n=1 Tax=Papaver nudicaule TaxID=74823 RepID=A0AA41VDX3_PAPNU|nr:hypothetical protein [Papaver nudicaule]
MECFAGKEDQGLQKRLKRDEDYYFKHKKTFKQFGVIVNDDLCVHDDKYYNADDGSKLEDFRTKRIKQEWRILQNGLPDTIYVRGYKGDDQLLRAVILGGKGTPFQDGLFFFDISFPPSYPNEPPIVTYHSYGYELHPDLESDGKVCLGLLNTSTRKDQWSTNVSKANILKVLMSIQKHILNPDKPKKRTLSKYFYNLEEKPLASYEASETFVVNGETMLKVMQKPPKDFEFFVAQHFRDHAKTVLRACLAYTDLRNPFSLPSSVPASSFTSSSPASRVAVLKNLGALTDDLYSRLYEAFLMNGSTLLITGS